MNDITVSKTGRIATVRFDRNTRANALSLDLMRQLTRTAQGLADDPGLNAVILTGRADCFSMGFDLKDPETQALVTLPLAQRRMVLQTGARMCHAWESLAPVTISALDGWCIGGGLALAVATDLRVCDAGCTLSAPEIERGFNMSWGAVPRLINLVGPARTKRIILLAKQLDAETAQAWGLVDEIAQTGSVLATAQALAQRAAEMPTAALHMGKQAINAYANAVAQASSHADFDQFALTQDSPDAHEGIQAFLDKRPPRFDR